MGRNWGGLPRGGWWPFEACRPLWWAVHSPPDRLGHQPLHDKVSPGLVLGAQTAWSRGERVGVRGVAPSMIANTEEVGWALWLLLVGHPAKSHGLVSGRGCVRSRRPGIRSGASEARCVGAGRCRRGRDTVCGYRRRTFARSGQDRRAVCGFEPHGQRITATHAVRGAEPVLPGQAVSSGLQRVRTVLWLPCHSSCFLTVPFRCTATPSSSPSAARLANHLTTFPCSVVIV